MTDTWHARPDALVRYAEDPAGLDHAQASSIEAHLLTCSMCRAAVAAQTPQVELDALWHGVTDRVDRPRRSWLELVLVRIGIDEGMARLVASTPSLRAAGLAAIVAVATAAAALSRAADADGPFLALAPLLPLVAVAAAFAPAADPAGEAGVATPMHGAALVVRRAVAVLVVSFGLLALVSLTAPDIGPSIAAWILPALALAISALALATWMRLEVAVGALATAWVVLVATSWWLSSYRDVAGAGSFSATGQVVALAAALAATTTLIVRRDRLATLEAFR